MFPRTFNVLIKTSMKFPSSKCVYTVPNLRCFSTSTENHTTTNEVENKNHNNEVDPLITLQLQNKKLEEEVKNLKDKLLRSYAEEENVRRIAQRDVTNAKEYANTKFAKSLLEVADNLERAISVVDIKQRESYDKTFQSLLAGVEMTDKGLMKIFNEYGIVKVIIILIIYIVK